MLQSPEQQLGVSAGRAAPNGWGERHLEEELIMCPRSGAKAKRFGSVWKHAGSLAVGGLNLFCQETRKHHSKEL